MGLIIKVILALLAIWLLWHLLGFAFALIGGAFYILSIPLVGWIVAQPLRLLPQWAIIVAVALVLINLPFGWFWYTTFTAGVIAYAMQDNGVIRHHLNHQDNHITDNH
jgi:hypothetical protein